MPRQIVGKGLRFSLRHAPCAHICRYCLISESRKKSPLPFSRFENLVHKFHDWKKSSGRDDLDIGVFVGPSQDYDLDTLHGVARLRARRGGAFKTMNLGGLRIRRAEELESWIAERQEAGIEGVHASLAGSHQTHDKWNGRAGDFEYQTTILRLVGELGMFREERLFLTKNTLPGFDRLLDILEGLPGEARRRSVSLFFFAGLATRYEDERITEDIRDLLPGRIKALRQGRFGDWRSEREWIPIMLETADKPRRLILKMDVDETNIDALEQTPCEDIFAERERLYQQEYERMPSLGELAARYGDREGTKVYAMSRDVEGRWMAMRARNTGIAAPID